MPRKRTIGLVALFAALTTVFGIFLSVLLTPATAADDCQTFSETGFKSCGKFYAYWKSHGGLAQQGFPISDVFEEKNADPPAGDGKVHKVQYFQRARFEEHLENQPPYEVLLGLLGAEQHQAKYGQVNPGAKFLVVNGKRTETRIDIFDPKPGFIYLVVDLTVTNNTYKKQSTNPYYFNVKSNKNFSYDHATPTFALTKKLASTDLAPGEVVRGELAFEVSQDETIVSLVYDGLELKVTEPIP
jgi:hypothetical protein